MTIPGRLEKGTSGRFAPLVIQGFFAVLRMSTIRGSGRWHRSTSGRPGWRLRWFRADRQGWDDQYPSSSADRTTAPVLRGWRPRQRAHRLRPQSHTRRAQRYGEDKVVAGVVGKELISEISALAPLRHDDDTGFVEYRYRLMVAIPELQLLQGCVDCLRRCGGRWP